MKKKPYTWEEIREFLRKELGKTKHIMTFGTIGSCNVERDIDTIITKKPKSKSSLFYEEMHGIFDNLNYHLNKKYGVQCIRFYQCEPEFLTLSNFQKNDLAIHALVYTSYKQIREDWERSLLPGENIKGILEKNYNCLLGSVKDLFSKDFQDDPYSSMFYYIQVYDRINSNYSEKFLVEIMNFYYDFVFTKRLGLKAPIAKNKKDVRKYFYQLCDIVDKLNAKKSK